MFHHSIFFFKQGGLQTRTDQRSTSHHHRLDWLSVLYQPSHRIWCLAHDYIAGIPTFLPVIHAPILGHSWGDAALAYIGVQLSGRVHCGKGTL